jgi:hypothetical protein
MIANLAMTLIGLWFAYHAIFATAAGVAGPFETLFAGAAVTLLAAWARRTDLMTWPSATNMVLGLVILALTGVARTIGIDALASFWVLLLAGIAVAIVALWSILYRPDEAAVRRPSVAASDQIAG